jgi:hypothetical protein
LIYYSEIKKCLPKRRFVKMHLPWIPGAIDAGRVFPIILPPRRFPAKPNFNPILPPDVFTPLPFRGQTPFLGTIL